MNVIESSYLPMNYYDQVIINYKTYVLNKYIIDFLKIYVRNSNASFWNN